MKKLTFAGREPTLCKDLPDLIREAAHVGMSAMVVTNGTGVTDSLLDMTCGYLNAIKLSVDSSSDAVEASLGRGSGGHLAVVRRAARCCLKAGVPLMVNTVVTAENWNEDLHDLITELSPLRWKVFQVLQVGGENNAQFKRLAVTHEQFLSFARRHADLHPVVEDNRLMTGSYLMLDPLGRFFQHDGTRYVYSHPVLEVGVLEALREVGWDSETFLERGGRYTPLSPLGSREGGAVA